MWDSRGLFYVVVDPNLFFRRLNIQIGFTIGTKSTNVAFCFTIGSKSTDVVPDVARNLLFRRLNIQIGFTIGTKSTNVAHGVEFYYRNKEY